MRTLFQSALRTARRDALPTICCAVLFFVACDNAGNQPASPESNPEYQYPGFVLDVSGAGRITVMNGKADGRIFVYPGEIAPLIRFSFVDADGKPVIEAPDSVVVLLKLDDDSRTTVYPASMPDQIFTWSFSLTARRIGISALRFVFVPEGVCPDSEVAVQVAG